MTKTKNIKVQYSSRCSGSGYYSRYTYHPKIQMEGKWLEELGFYIGDSLKVEYEEGSIRITPAPKPLMIVAEQETSYTHRSKVQIKNKSLTAFLFLRKSRSSERFLSLFSRLLLRQCIV